MRRARPGRNLAPNEAIRETIDWFDRYLCPRRRDFAGRELDVKPDPATEAA